MLLVVPLTLLAHHVRNYNQAYLKQQTYLDPLHRGFITQESRLRIVKDGWYLYSVEIMALGGERVGKKTCQGARFPGDRFGEPQQTH